MYIYNTTFHLDKTVEPEFGAWLRDYRGKALATGLFESVRILAVRSEHMEEGVTAYALHLETSDNDNIGKWTAGIEADCLPEIFSRWPQRAVAFSTLLEEID